MKTKFQNSFTSIFIRKRKLPVVKVTSSHSNLCTKFGFTVMNSCRVLSMDSADIIVHASVFFEVEVLICVVFCNIYQMILDVVVSKLANFDK